MSENKVNSGQSIALAAVALLAGILFGIVGAHLFGVNGEVVDDNSDTGASQAEIDFRAGLNASMIEQTSFSFEYLQAVYEQDPKVEALEEALETNTGELTSMLGVIVGEEAVDELQSRWNSFLLAQTEYVVAVREGDADDLNAAEEAQEEVAAELLSYMAEASGRDTDEMPADWVRLAENWQRSIDSYIAGNYQESYESRLDANELTRQLADELSRQLTGQYPDRF